MNKLRTYLDNLSRQLDMQNAPKNCVIPSPADESFNRDLGSSYWTFCYGADKDGFEGIVIQYNDRKFYFLDAIIDY